MKTFNSFAGDALLLSKDGSTIPVLNHPSADFEFESILHVLSEYGNVTEKYLVDKYEVSPNDDLKHLILSIYDNTWCKVREWEGRHLVTFRITSTNSFDWYPVILDFLLTHTEYMRSHITVETDERTGVRRTYWDELPYVEATQLEQGMIMATNINIYL